VEAAVKHKKLCYSRWRKSKTQQDSKEYVRVKGISKKVVAKTKKATSEEFAEELVSDDSRRSALNTKADGEGAAGRS
jgi:hypothetical protein